MIISDKWYNIKCLMIAHIGHKLVGELMGTERVLHLLGYLHLILLHFPIALIIMTCIAELLYVRDYNPLYKHAARFMILSAAFFALPTVLSGFAFAFEAHYESHYEDIFT